MQYVGMGCLLGRRIGFIVVFMKFDANCDAFYPGVGSEGILVLIAFVIWIGWHVISARQESEKLSQLARRRPGSSAWKNNVTDG